MNSAARTSVIAAGTARRSHLMARRTSQPWSWVATAWVLILPRSPPARGIRPSLALRVIAQVWGQLHRQKGPSTEPPWGFAVGPKELVREAGHPRVTGWGDPKWSGLLLDDAGGLL